MVIRAVKKDRMSMGSERRGMKVRRRCGGRPEGVTWVPSGLVATQFLIVWGGRDETAKGLMKIMTKLSTADARKRPNIQWETVLARLRGCSMSEGRATISGSD